MEGEQERAFLKEELTAVKRKKRASTVNMSGVVSHDEMRRMEKKAIATGMDTKNSTSMTRRGLGSRAPAEPGRGEMADPAACNAVDRRDTNIEPAPPGSPEGNVNKNAIYCLEGKQHTAKRYSEHCIAFVAAYECVQHSSRCAGDDHRTEKWRPPCAEQWPDVLISPDNRNGRDGATGDDRDNGVGNCSTYAEGKDCRHYAQ